MDIASPVNLTEALASFADVYSPRIVARVNDYDVRIAHTHGEHVWHVHEDTDEFFLVLDGRFNIAVRDDDGTERTIVLTTGDTRLRTGPGRSTSSTHRAHHRAHHG